MTGDLAPDGVDDLKPLAQDLWSGTMGGREVVVREVFDAASLLKVEVLKRLDVPGLPPLLDGRSRAGRSWVVFEKIKGETLAKRLDREGELPPAAALEVVRRGARVLDALARARLCHGAIRPTNIVFEEGGNVMFVDAVWSHPGTPLYEAPEGNVDVRSDLYSLGLVLYEMMIGMPPFVTSDRAVLAALKASGRIRFDAVEGFPHELAEALARLTDPDPGARLSDPVELLRVIGSSEHATTVHRARRIPPLSPETTRIPPPPGATRSGGPPTEHAPMTRRLAPVDEVGSLPWSRILVAVLLAAAVVIPSVVAWRVVRAVRETSPAPPPTAAQAAPPAAPPPPPPRVFAPEEIAEERERAERFLPTADELIGLRDYERFDALTPELRSPEGRARLEELIGPHRRAARAWRAAMVQVAALKGREDSFQLRPGGSPLAGWVEEIRLPRIRVNGQEASVRDFSSSTIVRLASSGPEPATGSELLAFAVFEKDAPSARAIVQGLTPDPWAAARLDALFQEADALAARQELERAAGVALRSADRSYKDYRPEMWWDVVDLHPGTAAATSAREKVEGLRRSLARWSFNDQQAGGWSGELEPGSRWSVGGSRLKGAVKEDCAAAERAGTEPLFVAEKGARLRFDYRIQGMGKVTVRLEGEAGSAAASVEPKISGWQTFDRPLADFEGARFADGGAVRAIRIESRSPGALQGLLVDSVEVYVPK